MLVETRLSYLECGFSEVSHCPTVALGKGDTIDPTDFRDRGVPS